MAATMAESLAERRRKDEQVRETINMKLTESGEKERCVGRVLWPFAVPRCAGVAVALLSAVELAAGDFGALLAGWRGREVYVSTCLPGFVGICSSTGQGCRRRSSMRCCVTVSSIADACCGLLLLRWPF